MQWYYKITDSTRPIQIRDTADEAPSHVELRRIYHRKKAWHPLEDGEFIQYKNFWYAVHNEASGSYISVDEKQGCVYPLAVSRTKK